MPESVAIYQKKEIDLLSICKKMMSHLLLLLVMGGVGVITCIIWFILNQDTYFNSSASYEYRLSPISVFSDLYGVDYIDGDQMVSIMMHSDTILNYFKSKGISEQKLSVNTFKGKIKFSRVGNIINVSINNVKESQLQVYMDYVSYCIDLINSDVNQLMIPQFENAKKIVEEELSEIINLEFNNETANSSNYQYIITLNDRIKSINTQIDEISKGSLRLFSEFDRVKCGSKISTMIMILFCFCVIGIFIDLLICLFDDHIYFSTDLTERIYLSDFLLSCIPLRKDNVISDKDLRNLISKLPKETKRISVSETYIGNGASLIQSGLKSISSYPEIVLKNSQEIDGGIISFFPDFDVNLVVLRAGVDRISQIINFVQDCRIKGVDNYYFIINGADPSDKRVFLLDSKSQYVSYSILSFRTLKQHFRRISFD